MSRRPLDVALFSNQFPDPAGHGLKRYARELFHELARLDGLAVTPVAAWSGMAPGDLARLQHQTGLRLVPLGRRLTPLAWSFLDAAPLERWLPGRTDLVHATALGYPVATRRPFVVTIHDLGPLTHPQFFRNTRPWVMARALAQAVRQAAAVICVSQSTAEEVRAHVGPAIEGRLHVVREGVAARFFDAPDPACMAGLPLPPDGAPFLLAAGRISPRKNIQGILAALALLARELPHHLVLTGASGWDMEVLAPALADPGLQGRVHFLGHVTDAQLRALYACAAVYLHPSLYEGFGLTVLEAMAAGAPVITSDRSSLPEVAGSAGRLVDPEDPVALAGAIREICADPALAERMSAAGRQHAAGFRWDDCARAVRDIYLEVADG